MHYETPRKHRIGRIGARPGAPLLALCGLAYMTAMATPRAQESSGGFSRESVEFGVEGNEADCAKGPFSVWITVKNTGYCIRYHVAEGGRNTNEVIVYVHGDVGVVHNHDPTLPRRWRLELQAHQKLPDTKTLQEFADVTKRYTGLTAIVVSRMGLFGSSGEHRFRRTPLEVDVTDEALNKIKERHHLEVLHLVGHSGGAQVALGVVARRRDLGCVVLGAASILSDFQLIWNKVVWASWPSLRLFDPEEAIDQIVANGANRMFIVSDRLDKRVPFHLQEKLVETLRRRGRPVEHVIVQAKDENHHDVTVQALGIAAKCATGMDTASIIRHTQR